MLTSAIRRDYEEKFASAAVAGDRRREIEQVVTQLMKHRAAYEEVTAATGVPWFVVAVVHQRECSGRWDCHLFNGDPLSARTVRAPKGYPLAPPASGHAYTWSESAIAAMRHDGFDAWRDWSVGGALWKLECYNGLGYRNRNLPSAYIWAATQHYTTGKFIEVREGGKYVVKFRQDLVDRQLGAAAVLRRMADQHLIELTPTGAEAR